MFNFLMVVKHWLAVGYNITPNFLTDSACGSESGYWCILDRCMKSTIKITKFLIYKRDERDGIDII